MEKEIEWEGMVVVTTMHGEKFLGWIPGGMTREAWEKAADASVNKTVELQNVRTMLAQITQIKAQNNADPRAGKLAVFLALMCIDAFSGPAESMKIRASTWYFPVDNPSCRKQFARLIKDAESNEMIGRANAAGIHTAGGNVPPRAMGH